MITVQGQQHSFSTEEWMLLRGSKQFGAENVPSQRDWSWWRHQMETFSALLAIYAENSSAPGEFPTQRPVTRSFDVFFDLCPNKGLSKQSWSWWFETPSHPLGRHRNADRSAVSATILRPDMFLNTGSGDIASFVCNITVTSWWERWRLKSPAPRLFAQPFVQAQIKENIKALRHWPLWGESTGDWWFPSQKCQ